MNQIYSPRGHLLAVSVLPIAMSVLTVELYSKWYSLFLVELTAELSLVPSPFKVSEVAFPEWGPGYDYPDLREWTSGYVDHCPSPVAVMQLAKQKGWAIDELAMELIVGRWEMEVSHRYDKAIERFEP